MVWYAKPGCPAHLVDALQKKVNSFPVAWLEAPLTGEVFDSIDSCRDRLKAFSLAEGFDVVSGGSTGQYIYRNLVGSDVDQVFYKQIE
jgi:hypothetical protein